MRTRSVVVGILPFASAVLMNAAVISLGPAVMDDPAGPAVGGLPAGPWSFEIPFTVDLTTPGTSLGYFGNWAVIVTDGTLGPFYVVTIESYHVVAPHAGELSPGPTFLAGVLFPPTAGSGGSAFGVVPHGADVDDWLLSATVDPGGTTASGTVKAWHFGVNVPEPSTYGLVGGLGLVAFAAYRRMRA